jgi:hypothetical protein
MPLAKCPKTRIESRGFAKTEQSWMLDPSDRDGGLYPGVCLEGFGLEIKQPCCESEGVALHF